MKNERLRTNLPCIVLITLAAIFLNSCGSPANNSQNANSRTDANASPTANKAVAPPTCDDAAINAAITAMFTPESDLMKIKNHINFDSKSCTVYLSGYTGYTSIFKQFEKEISAVSGVQKIDNVEFWVLKTEARLKPEPGDCISPWKTCGEICIPENQTCWTKEIQFSTVKPTPTPAANK